MKEVNRPSRSNRFSKQVSIFPFSIGYIKHNQCQINVNSRLRVSLSEALRFARFNTDCFYFIFKTIVITLLFIFVFQVHLVRLSNSIESYNSK